MATEPILDHKHQFEKGVCECGARGGTLRLAPRGGMGPFTLATARRVKRERRDVADTVRKLAGDA